MYVSDADLLGKWLKDSDSDAFAEIVSRHAGMVYGTCRRILGDAVEAEDVTQGCFIKLCEVRNLKGSSLRGLLHTLATHLSLNRLRAQSRRRKREIAFAMSRDRRTTPNWEDLRPCIDEAIDDLPERFRYLIISRFLQNQTYEAIAQTLGIDESTVRYRVNKGIDHVRRSLQRRGISLEVIALAAMLQAQMSEAAALPIGLKAALGKLAVAGRPELVAGASTAGGALGASKLTLIGGTALMWKTTLLVLGAVMWF